MGAGDTFARFSHIIMRRIILRDVPVRRWRYRIILLIIFIKGVIMTDLKHVVEIKPACNQTIEGVS